jgi:predicted metalloprotease with PDZ domain
MWKIALALAWTWTVLLTPAKAETYTVKLDFQEPLHASVQARMAVLGGKLFVHGHAGGYEWSDFIKNLRAYRKDGTEIPVISTGTGQWHIDALQDEDVNLAYEVDLSFTKELREGTQRGGQFFGTSLYIVNRALFVMSDIPGPLTVKFLLPSGFRIATPWRLVAPAIYRAEDAEDLSDNATVLGDFPSFRVAQGPFHLAMALPGSTSANRALMEPVIRGVLREYMRMLPATPQFHVLLTYFRGVEINGEGYRDSATLTSADPIEDSNRILWANYLAHELFHHWNAALIRGEDEGSYFGTAEWFSEGATEYIANRTLVRLGIITPQQYVRKIESNVGIYSFWTWNSAFRGISLQAAGSKTALALPKGEIAKTYNRAGVYNGGLVASLCIDALIGRYTHGARDIDDLFRVLLERHGLNARPYTPSDLMNAASEAAGYDLSPFFQTYIYSPNPLPVQDCLTDAGFKGLVLNYAGEAFVTSDRGASPQAMRFRKHLLEGAARQ